jgi:hypothetical protein
MLITGGMLAETVAAHSPGVQEGDATAIFHDQSWDSFLYSDMYPVGDRLNQSESLSPKHPLQELSRHFQLLAS